MTVSELIAWLKMVPHPKEIKVFFVTPGEQGRSDTYTEVRDVNVEFHGQTMCILHPEVMKFHYDLKPKID